MATSDPGHPGPFSRSMTFRGEKLCDTCVKLDLSVEKFMIGNTSLARSIKRSIPSFKRDTHGMARPPGIQLNSGLRYQSLGKYIDLRQRKCMLCWLVTETIDRYTADVDKLTDCSMVWEVDGRRIRMPSNGFSKNNEKYVNISRRIRFWWKQADLKVMEAYILLVAPDDPIEEDTNRRKQQKPVFLAKHFDIQQSKHSVIKDWLSICERGHLEVCSRLGAIDDGTYHNDSGRNRRWTHLLNKTSFGVVDVIRMKLCRLPDWHTEYVALSYVWGQGNKSHQTQRTNVVKRTDDGGIKERDLPKTIKDAIQLTRDLGLRYIWIDSLCIVQDSNSSFRLNAANMDLIYGNAHLTICAADGNDANEGLVALDPDKADTPIRASYSDMRLQVIRPSESVIHDSVWDQRAWTFQERILSRRCLVFAGRRVYFQCRSSNMSEDIHRDATGLGLSMDSTNSPLRTLKEMQPRPIWFYMTCVSLYTGRHLTYAKDIIPAFEGVSSFMQTRMHGPMARFVYGLPPSHFDLALLWEPLTAQRRRYPSSEGGNADPELDLPSWSWAGWMDPEDVQKGSPVKYKQETLDGCFIDVREWLIEHTWISWFIRNSDGDLRPLWHREHIPEVEGPQPQKRWHGYEVAARRGQEVEASSATEKSCSSLQPQAYAPIAETRYSTIHPPAEHKKGAEGRQRLWERETNERVRDAKTQAKLRHFYYKTTESEDRCERYDQKRLEDVPPEGSNEDDRRVDHRRLIPLPPPPQAIKDQYGRRPRIPHSSSFTHVIPDNPFGVNEDQFGSKRAQEPDQTILQFFTWEAQFYVLQREDQGAEKSRPGKGLVRCDVADENKDWCGHIVLNKDWLDKRDSLGAPAGDQKARFIAISEAKSFTSVECPNWAHYIPRERDDSEWDLVFVLLIELNQKRLVWERVGLGKVFRSAFDLYPSWEEILLG